MRHRHRHKAKRHIQPSPAGSAHYYNNVTTGSAESVFKAVRIA